MSTRFLILVFVTMLAGLAACKNNDNVFSPVNLSGRFKVINSSADTLNYYLNGTRQNNGSSIVPGGTTYYLVVPTGMQTFQFKKNGGFDVLFSVPEKLADSTNYSLYVTGRTAADAFSTVDRLFPDTALDTLTQVRFVHAAPDAGNVDVYIGDTVNFKTVNFKTSSEFKTFGSGLKRIRVYQSGSPAARVDTSIAIPSGHIYTLFTYGLIGGAGAARFNVGLTLNL